MAQHAGRPLMRCPFGKPKYRSNFYGIDGSLKVECCNDDGGCHGFAYVAALMENYAVLVVLVFNPGLCALFNII
jgi:hypothetical protein